MGCLADKNDASVLPVRIGLVRVQGFHVHRALIVPGTLRDGRLLCGLHLDVVVGVIILDRHPSGFPWPDRPPLPSFQPPESGSFRSACREWFEHKVVRKCQILNLLQVSRCSPFCRPGASHAALSARTTYRIDRTHVADWNAQNGKYFLISNENINTKNITSAGMAPSGVGLPMRRSRKETCCRVRGSGAHSPLEMARQQRRMAAEKLTFLHQMCYNVLNYQTLMCIR